MSVTKYWIWGWMTVFRFQMQIWISMTILSSGTVIINKRRRGIYVYNLNLNDIDTEPILAWWKSQKSRHVTMIGELALALLRRGPRMSDRGRGNPNSRPRRWRYHRTKCFPEVPADHLSPLVLCRRPERPGARRGLNTENWLFQVILILIGIIVETWFENV